LGWSNVEWQKKIKPVSFAIVELHLSGSQLVSQEKILLNKIKIKIL